jgi:Ca2+-binding EF-hand superfamily protein
MGNNTNEEWNKIIQEVDKNSKGTINYKKFLSLMKKMLR